MLIVHIFPMHLYIPNTKEDLTPTAMHKLYLQRNGLTTYKNLTPSLSLYTEPTQPIYTKQYRKHLFYR